MQDEAPMAHSPPILKGRSLVKLSDTAPSKGYTKGTTGALVVPSHTDMVMSQSDAVAAVATAATTLAPQSAVVHCPCPGTKAPTTPRINTGITTQISEDKPGPFPALTSPRIIKLPVTPSSHSTSTSGGSLLTKRPPNHNALSYPVPQPSQRQGEKRVRVEESRFEPPSKVVVKASIPPQLGLGQSESGQSSTVDIHTMPILSPTRNGRTVFLATNDSSPIAPDHAFTIKPGSTAISLPLATLADLYLHCSPVTNVPKLTRDPCLRYHSTLGCSSPSCMRDHTIPVIGSLEWTLLKIRIQKMMMNSPNLSVQFRDVRPQAYLGMGEGFEKVRHHKIDYCLPSFTTIGCLNGMGCLRCHDLPRADSFGWAFLCGALLDDIKDNQPQKYNDTFDLLPELKRRGLVMPPIASKALVVPSPAVASVTSGLPLSSSGAVAAVESGPLVRAGDTCVIAVVESKEPILQESDATDLVIPSACTAQDLLYLHTNELEEAATTAAGTVDASAKSTLVTFTLKGAIAPPPSSSPSVPTRMPVPTPTPTLSTYTFGRPCLDHYSTSECHRDPCLSHLRPRIGSEDWYTVRDSVVLEARIQDTRRIRSLQPVPYLGLATGFKALNARGCGTSLVTYCLHSFTSARCKYGSSCWSCHDPPLPGTEEWTHLKARLREYMLTHSNARYADRARKHRLAD